VNLQTGEILDVYSVKNKKSTVFCGIGNAGSFFRMLHQIGITLVSHIEFADHKFYTRGDIEKIKHEFLRHQAEIVITTEKDAVRLFELKRELLEVPIYYIEINTHFIESEKEFLKKVANLKCK
jgi:tetraacyldisaccharide 4'-kinase